MSSSLNRYALEHTFSQVCSKILVTLYRTYRSEQDYKDQLENEPTALYCHKLQLPLPCLKKYEDQHTHSTSMSPVMSTMVNHLPFIGNFHSVIPSHHVTSPLMRRRSQHTKWRKSVNVSSLYPLSAEITEMVFSLHLLVSRGWERYLEEAVLENPRKVFSPKVFTARVTCCVPQSNLKSR